MSEINPTAGMNPSRRRVYDQQYKEFVEYSEELHRYMAISGTILTLEEFNKHLLETVNGRERSLGTADTSADAPADIPQ